MKKLFLFPGQGAQMPDFLDFLPDAPVVKQTLEEASDILGVDIRTKDTLEDLQTTYWTQLTLVSASVACSRFLIQEGFLPDGVLGLSLGSYSAAVICGVISFADGLKLLEKRAEIMQNAFPSDYGMVSVMGLSESAIQALLQNLDIQEYPLYIANVNSPFQVVLSGHTQAFVQLKELFLSHGATKVVVLKVKVPSHCPLFLPYVSQLQTFAQTLLFTDPVIPFFSPMLKRTLYTAQAVSKDLVENMANPLNIFDTGVLAYEKGFYSSVEMLPGKILTNILRSFLPDLYACALSEFNLQDIVSSLQIRLP